jgi:hypothetical protein
MAFKQNFEQFILNDARTSLNEAIDATQTSFDVVDGSKLPANGNFRVKVDDEIILVTARSVNTLTVTRGAEGTTGVAHNLNASCRGVMTEGAIQQLYRDKTPMYGQGLPMATFEDNTGAKITLNDFTWFNQGGTTSAEIHQGYKFTIPRTTGVDIRGMYRSAPSTPFTVTACMGHSCTEQESESNDFPWIGLGFRESATSKMQGVVPTGWQRLSVVSWTNSTTIANEDFLRQRYPKDNNQLWARIEDNGTNLIYSVSLSGEDWTPLFTQGRGVHFTTAPDQICILMHGRWGTVRGSDTDHVGTILHWSEA